MRRICYLFDTAKDTLTTEASASFKFGVPLFYSAGYCGHRSAVLVKIFEATLLHQQPFLLYYIV